MRVFNILIFVMGVLFFSGCSEKQSVLYIQNQALCQAPNATLYLSDVDVANHSQSFNITKEQITLALAQALSETNCYKVVLQNRDVFSLQSDDEFVLNVKADIYQDSKVVSENFFKKEQSENLTLVLNLDAKNSLKNVRANAKSELSISKERYFGVERGANIEADRANLLRTATKKVSISLTNGFRQLR